MIPHLDRYVCRVYLSSWLVSLVFFVGFFGVLDFFGKIDDLFDTSKGAEIELGVIARFYIYKAPSIYLKVVPFVMLMTALVTITRLQRHNEFMAMLLVGRSDRRILRPLFVMTALFVLMQVGMQEWVSPRFAEARARLETKLLEHEQEWVIEEINLRDAHQRQIRALDYNVDTGVIGNLMVSYRDENGDRVRVEGFDATYDERARGWRLHDGERTVSRGTSGEVPDVAPAAFCPTEIRPGDLLVEDRDPFDKSYDEILAQSERYPFNRSYKLLRHYHVTYPISVMLLVLLGVPFVTRREIRSPLVGLGYALGLCFLFMALDTASRSLGVRGVLSPVLAAWVPVIVAGSLVVVLFDSNEAWSR